MTSVKNNKSYDVCNLSVDSSLFRGYYQDKYEVSDEILRKLSKDLGFSYDLYLTMVSISPEASASLVASMSKQSNHTEITLLLDEEKVVGYSLEAPRTPLLNSDFLKRATSLADTSDAIKISEVNYHPDDTVSSLIIKRVNPITIEEKYEGRESKFFDYDIGIMLVNDELSTSYSRLVLYLGGQPVYLPASYYNATSSRFKRSTSDAADALEVLMLKIIEDLREDELHDKIYDFHYRYRYNKCVLATYEELNTILKTLRRIPTIIEDNSCLEDLLEKYAQFERKYAQMEEKKSSYIWRCTAMGGISIEELSNITLSILNEVSAPAIEYSKIRELLGEYLSTDRISTEIAHD